MDEETAQRLISLNHQFYQTFAVHFSDTRQRIQPGVRRVIETWVDPQQRLLDLGCGNGELARVLAQMGHRAAYVGLDFSAGLLAEARQAAPTALPAVFVQRDLSTSGWETGLPHSPFDRLLAFAVLHHIPGLSRRLAVLETARSLLRPGGRVCLSVWQFLNSPRLASRVQPWSAAGLDDADLDPGDYLMDWRRGGQGLRYVHHFSSQELEVLAQRSGFEIQESFASDGETGNLGLYQIWKETGRS